MKRAGRHHRDYPTDGGFAMRENITNLEQRGVAVYAPARLPRTKPDEERHTPATTIAPRWSGGDPALPRWRQGPPTSSGVPRPNALPVCSYAAGYRPGLIGPCSWPPDAEYERSQPGLFGPPSPGRYPYRRGGVHPAALWRPGSTPSPSSPLPGTPR